MKMNFKILYFILVVVGVCAAKHKHRRESTTTPDSPVAEAQSGKKPRVVNVALETEVLIKPDDVPKSLAFLRNAKQFIEQLSNILETQETKQQRVDDSLRQRSIVIDSDSILSHISNTVANMTISQMSTITAALKNRFDKLTRSNFNMDSISAVLRNEDLRRYMNKNLRRFLGYDYEPVKVITRRALNVLGGYNMETLKSHGQALLTAYKPIINKVFRKVNSYYSPEDIEKIKTAIADLKYDLNANKDINPTVDKILRYGIYNKVENLNDTTINQIFNDVSGLASYVGLDLKPNNEEKYRRNFESAPKKLNYRSNNPGTDMRVNNFIVEVINNDGTKANEIKLGKHGQMK